MLTRMTREVRRGRVPASDRKVEKERLQSVLLPLR
jgi:hypothetical protein